MARGTDDYDRAWIQGGTARIPARGEPFGGPLLVDDTPPEIKEHLRREERKEGSFFAADNLAGLYGRHQTALSEEFRKTTTLAGAKGLTERILKDYDADVLTSDEARQRFTDDALDLRQALETGAAEVEYRFQDLGRRSALEIKAGALGRQAEKHPEDYPLHAAMLDKVVAGAAALVKPENAAAFRRVEAEKMARSAMMGFIDQGRFDEGRALLATATDAEGGPGPLPLSADAVKELGGTLETRRGEAAAREERLDRVDTVIEGTAGPTEDPKEWQALVEEHFAVVAPQMAELEPAERIEVEDDYVRNLGHLPKPLMQSLRAGMLSGEADQEAAAALRIKTLADHDPALVEVIPEFERARAAAIAEFAELGLKNERAVELGDDKLQETWSRRSGVPEGPGGDYLSRPEDEIGDQRVPMVDRPGYVWKTATGAAETPEEARDKFQPLSAEGDGGGDRRWRQSICGRRAMEEATDQEGQEPGRGEAQTVPPQATDEDGDAFHGRRERECRGGGIASAGARSKVPPLPPIGSAEPKNYDDMYDRLKLCTRGQEVYQRPHRVIPLRADQTRHPGRKREDYHAFKGREGPEGFPEPTCES